MPDVVRCKYCARPIFLVPTPSGAWMPLDPAPNPLGNIVMERAVNESGDQLGARRARVLKRGEVSAPGAQRWQSHFASCEKYPRRRKGERVA